MKKKIGPLNNQFHFVSFYVLLGCSTGYDRTIKLNGNKSKIDLPIIVKTKSNWNFFPRRVVVAQNISEPCGWVADQQTIKTWCRPLLCEMVNGFELVKPCDNLEHKIKDNKNRVTYWERAKKPADCFSSARFDMRTANAIFQHIQLFFICFFTFFSSSTH